MMVVEPAGRAARRSASIASSAAACGDSLLPPPPSPSSSCDPPKLPCDCERDSAASSSSCEAAVLFFFDFCLPAPDIERPFFFALTTGSADASTPAVTGSSSSMLALPAGAGSDLLRDTFGG